MPDIEFHGHDLPTYERACALLFVLPYAAAITPLRPAPLMACPPFVRVYASVTFLAERPTLVEDIDNAIGRLQGGGIELVPMIWRPRR